METSQTLVEFLIKQLAVLAFLKSVAVKITNWAKLFEHKVRAIIWLTDQGDLCSESTCYFSNHLFIYLANIPTMKYHVIITHNYRDLIPQYDLH